MQRVLVTGSSGLIGRALHRALARHGVEVARFDLLEPGDGFGDVRDRTMLAKAMEGCDGVVHLAAVSRVEPAERDIDGCMTTNVGGTQNVVDVALAMKARPWLLLASSREVYGDVDVLPADETTDLRPINCYGRSKLLAERAVERGGIAGLRTGIIRLANVYGSADDHPERVVPAFARAALAGEPLVVRGAELALDFTHRDDVVRGLLAAVAHLAALPGPMATLQLVSGRPTTLGELAACVRSLAGSRSPIHEAPTRDGSVRAFYGSHARAHAELGWSCQVSLERGVDQLLGQLRRQERAPCSSSKEMR